jgi:drug/metabolite transporter (DMT)-like permease
MGASARGAAMSMVLATMLWGATFVAIRDVVAHVPPVSLVFARFAVAATVLGIVAAARRVLPGRSTLAVGGLSGALAAGGFLFQAIGLTATSAGSSAFLTSGGTLFAALFAWPLLRQRPTGLLALGLVVALIGSALLSIRNGLTLGVGEAWTLAGALLYALQIVVLGRFAARHDPIALTAAQALAIAVLLAPFAGRAPGVFHLLSASCSRSSRCSRSASRPRWEPSTSRPAGGRGRCSFSARS